MKLTTRAVAVACALLAAACTAKAEPVDGVAYQIPAKNLLRNTFAAEFVRLQYGRSEDAGELGLVFSGAELAAAIPGYNATAIGYVGPFDNSTGVIVTTAGNVSNFDEFLSERVAELALDQPLERYRDTEFGIRPESSVLWQLLEPDGRWRRGDMLPPSCRQSKNEDGTTRDSCHFRVKRDGFEFTFSLRGDDVDQADELVDFVLANLKKWEVPPEN
jgi:hypothetical protein